MADRGKPVAKGNVPGEWYSPTQPFPTKPAPYARGGVTPDELIDFTPGPAPEGTGSGQGLSARPDLHAAGVEQGKRSAGDAGPGPATGGTNWPGGSFNPENHTVYVYACNACMGTDGMVTPPQDFTDLPYVEGQVGQPVTMIYAAGANQGADAVAEKSKTPYDAPPARNTFRDLSVEGLPLIKPPYSTISAINLDTGQIEWQVAHGDTPDYIRRQPGAQRLGCCAHRAAQLHHWHIGD